MTASLTLRPSACCWNGQRILQCSSGGDAFLQAGLGNRCLSQWPFEPFYKTPVNDGEEEDEDTSDSYLHPYKIEGNPLMQKTKNKNKNKNK